MSFCLYHILVINKIIISLQWNLWIRQTVGTARHVSGTCKMGPDSDPMAVVDQYCKVKGVQGLWVADASVMPRIPNAALHAPTIMIGEKAAAMIRSG